MLVVGASHSGADIAYELAASHHTILSGVDTGQIPARVDTRRGRMGFRALVLRRVAHPDDGHAARAARCARTSGTAARRCSATGGRICSPRVSSGRSRGRSACEDGQPVLDDGRVLDVRNVVWCTGFRPDFSWIDVPFDIDDDGYPVQYRGVVDSAPGLYFVGLLFLHSFTSMLIGGTGRDAERVAKHIALQAVSGRAVAPAALRMPEQDCLVSSMPRTQPNDDDPVDEPASRLERAGDEDAMGGRRGAPRGGAGTSRRCPPLARARPENPKTLRLRLCPDS